MSPVTRRQFLQLTAGATVSAGLAGCTDTAAPDPAPVVADHVAARTSPRPPTRPTPSPPAAPSATATAPAFLGMVPVLMHHRLVDGEAGTYDMTPQFFRAELERLYREKYHPIRTIDLARGNFSTVPAGKRPVVLTFDDSSPRQFAVDTRGRVDPQSALGIMLDFQRKHSDFPAVASFYINQNPFGYRGADVARALRKLEELDCEIGNHTLTHPNLRSLSDAEVQAELGGLSALVAAAGVPPPRTLALPLGVHPRRRSLLAQGGSGRTAYRNEGVLLVGANPAPSSYRRDFDPMAIPRIRCSSHAGGKGELELAYWLDRLRRDTSR